jgi:sulfate transport system substrate-binding protein
MLPAVPSVAEVTELKDFEVGVTYALWLPAGTPRPIVDRVAARHGTTQVATEYLKYLYSPEGQEIAARHYFRPRNAAVAKKYSNRFPKVRLFTIDDVFGGWFNAQRTHFNDGGVFDQIYGG